MRGAAARANGRSLRSGTAACQTAAAGAPYRLRPPGTLELEKQFLHAVAEQATASAQLAKAADDIRRETDQTSRGIAEQARAAAEITAATENVTTQIALITRANVEQSTAVEGVAQTFAELRKLAERTARSANDSSSVSASLQQRVAALGHQAH